MVLKDTYSHYETLKEVNGAVKPAQALTINSFEEHGFILFLVSFVWNVEVNSRFHYLS